MNNLYLDANIFIYLSDKFSIYHKDCNSFINYCQNHNILISTSCETIQEIIHYAKNTKQLPTGLLVAKNVLELVDIIYSINRITVEIYLEQAEIYIGSTSRDLLHLSVCIENKLDKIITYDSDFNAFKGIKALKPQAFSVG